MKRNEFQAPEHRDSWAERDRVLPLPSKEDGYARVLLVGTTGGGKTTLVRQLLGTDPNKERFPSTSPNKTTVCDIEIIVGGDDFQAAVSFMSREQARRYIAECVLSAVVTALEGKSKGEVVRRLMTDADQQFRLNYILGPPELVIDDDPDESQEDEDEEDDNYDDAEITQEQQQQLAERISDFLEEVANLASDLKKVLVSIAEEVDVDLDGVTQRDRAALQELVEEELAKEPRYHELVDEILHEVEARFDCIAGDGLQLGNDGWPILWTHTSQDRAEFIKAVNQFSSNYFPNHGRLLTPLVDGMRVRGPFEADWQDGDFQQIVLLDGQGIGHVAESGSSISTKTTKRFQVADVILLVDNAAQPMQAASMSVLRTVVTSGYVSKLIVAFTHMDAVNGDNLLRTNGKKAHVLESFTNAAQAIGKDLGREAEYSLDSLKRERIVFLSKIQATLPENAMGTRSELSRMLQAIEASIEPPLPVEYHPVYDMDTLVAAMQRATQEFHVRWKAILQIRSCSNVESEPWQRIKALTRRVAEFGLDEFKHLRPVADLIQYLQNSISEFLSNPVDWTPRLPPDDAAEQRMLVTNAIRMHVAAKLHDFSKRRLIDERRSGWVEAYEHRGKGSTWDRAADLNVLYESAAPIPNEMPGPDAKEFVLELRELVEESIVEGGGNVLDSDQQALSSIG